MSTYKPLVFSFRPPPVLPPEEWSVCDPRSCLGHAVFLAGVFLASERGGAATQWSLPEKRERNSRQWESLCPTVTWIPFIRSSLSVQLCNCLVLLFVPRLVSVLNVPHCDPFSIAGFTLTHASILPCGAITI